jgi:hypothetical protein
MADKTLSNLTSSTPSLSDYIYGVVGSNSRKLQLSDLPFLQANTLGGAAGDGVTNDTSALSTAFNAGGIVFVPEGTYLIDPITISTPVHIIMHPEAVIKRRTATDGAHSKLLSFTTGSEGSTFEGGIVDGNRSSLAASYTNVNFQWPGIYIETADSITVRDVKFRNHVNWAVWVASGDGHHVSDLHITSSGKAVLFQFTNNSTCRDIFAESISNNGTAMYQHAFEFRQLERCTIDNIRVDGYTPDALGTDPWPIAFAIERVFHCKISGLFLDGYDGSETRNYGAQISNAENTSFSDFHFQNVFWGIEFSTALDCTLDGFTINGDFKTHASSDGYGLGLISAGVFQNDGDAVEFDTRANAPSKQVLVSNGSVVACEIGALTASPNIQFDNVIANANRFYGFQTREFQTNSAWFPGQPRPRVENVILNNCQARFNGFDGFIIEAGTQVQVNGGVYSDNGWDTSLGATFRAGVAMIEDASGGGIDRVSISNIYAGDTQTFTKTDGASFNPGSTVSSRFNIALIDPDQVAVGQYLLLVNATGSGDVTARVVALNLDEATVETTGSVTFSETGNLTSLTGTISTSGNTVTGSGTAFTTEIRGAAWIKAGGAYYHVQKVNSNTAMVIFPAPSPALSGATAQILTIDVQGIPSQQHGIVTDANVNGPVSLVNVNANGAVTSPTSIANAGCLDFAGTNSVMASAGIYARGGAVAIGSTDLTQAKLHVANTASDTDLLGLQGQSGSITKLGSFGGTHFFQTTAAVLEIGTVTAAQPVRFRTAGTARVVLTDSAWSPVTNDGSALGTTALGWADLHLATGGTFNFANGNWVATHTSGILTVGTGDLRVTNAGADATSVVTVGGGQTLTNKTLTSPTLTTPALGTPSSGTLTNCTGLPYGGIAAAAWSAFTPTISAQTGTLTSASGAGRFLQIGKMIMGTVTITITTAGTGAGILQFTLPVTAQAGSNVAYGVGRSFNAGNMQHAFAMSTTLGGCLDYDNNTPIADGETVFVNFMYEAA